MSDDTYRFVLAEEVALWVADINPDKDDFEVWIHGLTQLGKETAYKALDAIRAQSTVYETASPLGGIRVYSELLPMQLLAIAEKAVQ